MSDDEIPLAEMSNQALRKALEIERAKNARLESAIKALRLDGLREYLHAKTLGKKKPGRPVRDDSYRFPNED